MNLNQESVLALFAAWLRTQAAALGLFFGTLGLCAVFCWLYAAPAAPLRDAAVLCVAGLVGWGACGFARFVRRHRQLAALLSLPALDEQDFPPAASLTEADYQALALALEQPRAERLLPAVGPPNQNAHRRHAAFAAKPHPGPRGSGRAAHPH